MGGTLPNFLIAGAAKSGTTSLAAWLAAHPDVFVAAEKEVHFFNSKANWARGVDWYAEQLAAAGGARAVGEATPMYMFGPEAVERIAETLPGVRLIACLRDPVDRALSHYRHWYYRDVRERRSFADAIDDELAGRESSSPDPFHGYDPDVHHYVAHGEYLPQLERLAATFGRDRLHVVLLDDLRARPRETFAEVCRFLGVDPSVVPEVVGSRENAAYEFRPLWAWRLLVRHRHRLHWRVARFLALSVLQRPPRGYPPMEPEVRARLEAHYAEPNAWLAEWLGRELPWSSTAPSRERAVVA